MNCLSSNKQKLIEQLRVVLPLKARARPPLIEQLRRTISHDAARSNIPVTNVFDAGESLGLMCQLDLTPYCPRAPHLVVPLDHLALDRKYGVDLKFQRHLRRTARTAPQDS